MISTAWARMAGEALPAGPFDDQLATRLLHQRIVVLGQEVDDPIANRICAQLLLLSAEDQRRDISLYINSPGGSMSAMTAIYDTMQFVRAPVATTCVGQAASAAAVILAAGAPGRRYLLPHTRVLLHQPSSGGQGTISDLTLQANELLRVRSQMEEVLSRHTGQDIATLRADTDRDKIFTAQQAVGYGLADHIITSRELAVARSA